MSTQYHIGTNPDTGDKLWHSRDEDREMYWSGSWGDRSPKDLKLIAESILKDLNKHHHEAFLDISRKEYLEFVEDTKVTDAASGGYKVTCKKGLFESTAPSVLSAEQAVLGHWQRAKKEGKYDEYEDMTVEEVSKALGKNIRIIK